MVSKAKRFCGKIDEQKKWFEVEVEFRVKVWVKPVNLNVILEGNYQNFSEELVTFGGEEVVFEGTKFFDVEASSKDNARKMFEVLNTDINKWDVNLYIGTEYIMEGFESEIMEAGVKVVGVEEIEP